MPCAPFSPTVAITIRALEFYRVAHLRCPHLSIHAFVKTLCDLHMVPFKASLILQFSIAFDLYISIRNSVQADVQTALSRDTADYRLKNLCPPCTYKLEDEDPLKFAMLYTVDGNDSLKRIVRREAAPEESHGTEPILGKSSESTDTRDAGQGMYLTREQVDMWSKEILSATVPNYTEDPDSENPCAERWKNMKEELTRRMWGIFEETGLFLALCRHGFVLLLADMVRSGELSKYPLAIANKMMAVFGPDLAMGYDIGCRFKTTLNNSPLGVQARALNHSTLVGAFHGHAHNRLCQLRFLATYVEGLGLEDLEGCERFFSKSNALAGSTRYASIFHRRQAIIEYSKHNDAFETYQNLSTFLLNNYKQALTILNSRPTVLLALQKAGAVDGKGVEQWLQDEEVYLRGLTKEPLQETLEMEYYSRLVALQSSSRDVRAKDRTASMETARRHAMENDSQNLDAVQALEQKLCITVRWRPFSSEWKDAAVKVSMRTYQRAIDSLEGLVVARIFELTKMNQSHTGYHLRQHIGAALKARSQAVRTALDRYNLAALSMTPPRQCLDWDEVVTYAFLSDFDLLRDTRQDIRSKPWATPAARLALDQWFKLLRAEEEIKRLNVEIRRFHTYLYAEDAHLRSKEVEIASVNPSLAHQRARFNSHHDVILRKVYALPGYTGNPKLDEGEVELEEEQASEDHDEVQLGALLNVLTMSSDGPAAL
ncbi:hypothetical protein BJ912DRAFT_1026124 [Pholiota molesta]|nr:hypothetical protein BJ912DRAFT_1026124 [Pholiota molesta]